MFEDPYGRDVLSDDPHRQPQSQKVAAAPGLLIEDLQSGFVGEIVKVGRVAGQWQFEAEGRGGIRRSFRMGRGFWIEGKPVELVAPGPAVTKKGPAVTASGSFHVDHRARVARESRIWVEGKHDAELVSKVWGEDLAYEGIVVEELLGVDRLEEMIAQFQPSPIRRAGVLVDHLVPGSKGIAAHRSLRPHARRAHSGPSIRGCVAGCQASCGWDFFLARRPAWGGYQGGHAQAAGPTPRESGRYRPRLGADTSPTFTATRILNRACLGVWKSS